MKQNFGGLGTKTKILLLALVTVSTFVKFFELGYRSFSLDELYSVSAAIEPNFDKFLNDWVFYDSNPPLYYFFLRGWLKFFPATEFWVRFPSVIICIAAIGLFVRGIQQRFKNREWVFLLVLLSASYSFLFFAQEARGYAMLLLFTCLQLLYFIDLIKISSSTQADKKIVLFMVFGLLSCYTHYSGIVFTFLLISTLFFIHFRDKHIIVRLSIGTLLLLGCGMFWFPFFMTILKMDKSFVIDQNISVLKNIVAMLFLAMEQLENVSLLSRLEFLLQLVGSILMLSDQLTIVKKRY